MDRPQPEIRIGDRERREVDTRLQEAMGDGVLTLSEYDERAALCWAARVQRDLDPLTADLPDRRPAEQSSAAEKDTVALPSGGAPRSTPRTGSRMLGRAFGGLVAAAVVGAGLYVGYAAVSADDGASVFASGVVQVQPGQQRVEVGTLFGSVQVVVPDDVRVRTTGAVPFGSVECAEACRAVVPAGGPNPPEVVVDANGGFGSVDVVRYSDYVAGNSGDDGRDDDDEEEEDDDDD